MCVCSTGGPTGIYKDKKINTRYIYVYTYIIYVCIFYAAILCVVYIHINVSAGLPKREDRCLVRKPVFSAAKCHSAGTAQFSSFHLSIMLMLPAKPVTQKYKYDPIYARVLSPTRTDRTHQEGISFVSIRKRDRAHTFCNDKIASYRISRHVPVQVSNNPLSSGFSQ